MRDVPQVTPHLGQLLHGRVHVPLRQVAVAFRLRRGRSGRLRSVLHRGLMSDGHGCFRIGQPLLMMLLLNVVVMQFLLLRRRVPPSVPRQPRHWR